MKVLIIEDDKFTRTVYESELHQENIEVAATDNGEAGIDMAASEKPDVILLDMILPKKNGFEVLEALKKDKATKNIPVIVASALSQKVDIDEAMKLGANKYLSKENYSLKQIIKEVMNMLMTM